MTVQQLKQILETSGLSFAYRCWQEEHDLPYGLFRFAKSNNFAADGIAYSSSDRYVVELYTENKQPETESALETALTAAGIYWEKTGESYIETEQMQFTTYEIEV